MYRVVGGHEGHPGHVRLGGGSKVARLGESVQHHRLVPALPTVRLTFGLLLNRSEAGHAVMAGVSNV